MRPNKRTFDVKYVIKTDEDGNESMHRETVIEDYNPTPEQTPPDFKVECRICPQKCCMVKAVPEACKKALACSICTEIDKDGNIIPVVHDLSLGFPECPAVVSNR